MFLRLELVFLMLIATACTFECYAFDFRLSRQTCVKVSLKSSRKNTILFNLGSPGASDDGEALTDSLSYGQMEIDSSASTVDEAGATVTDEQLTLDSPGAILNEAGNVWQSSASPEAPFFTSVATAKALPSKPKFSDHKSTDMARRAWLQTGAIVFAGTLLGATSILHKNAVSSTAPKPVLEKPLVSPFATRNSTMTTTKRPEIAKLEPINITQVAAETNVNVTLNCAEGDVSVDSQTFTKVKRPKVPGWLPSWLAPRPKVIKTISDFELLIAAIIAGSTLDLVRTSLLYPIDTIKTRIQTDIHNYTSSPPPIQSRLVNFGTTVKRHVDEGNLYAGIKPSLMVSVPATGVYYGVRDISQRMLTMTPLNGVVIILSAALIGDVVSLCFRAPADALTLRLQNLDDDVGDWFGDSIKRLPSIIITDLPYLLSKIALNRFLIHGSISIDQYTEVVILTGKCVEMSKKVSVSYLFFLTNAPTIHSHIRCLVDDTF
jgi:hypothetical protein